MNTLKSLTLICLVGALCVAPNVRAERPLRPADSVENLLVDAETSGNLPSFSKGIRGDTDQMLYDPQRGAFAVDS